MWRLFRCYAKLTQLIWWALTESSTFIILKLRQKILILDPRLDYPAFIMHHNDFWTNMLYPQCIRLIWNHTGVLIRLLVWRVQIVSTRTNQTSAMFCHVNSADVADVWKMFWCSSDTSAGVAACFYLSFCFSVLLREKLVFCRAGTSSRTQLIFCSVSEVKVSIRFIISQWINHRDDQYFNHCRNDETLT